MREAQRVAGIEQGVHILRHTFCSAFAAAPLRRDKSRLAMKGRPRAPVRGHESERAQRVSHANGAGIEGPPRESVSGVWGR